MTAPLSDEERRKAYEAIEAYRKARTKFIVWCIGAAALICWLVVIVRG